MSKEIIMDLKGRILIPLEIRKQLNLQPGEKFIFAVENGRLILLKSSSYDEFLHEIDKFQQKLRKISNKPISTEKLF